MILKFSIEALMKSEWSGCFTRVTLKTGYSGDMHPVIPAICTHLLNYHFAMNRKYFCTFVMRDVLQKKNITGPVERV